VAEPLELGKRRLNMILRNAVPRLSRRWVVALLVVIVVGVPTFVGLRAITGADKIDPEDCQAVVKEMNRRIYDAKVRMSAVSNGCFGA
jgi:predicted amidohydrolase